MSMKHMAVVVLYSDSVFRRMSEDGLENSGARRLTVVVSGQCCVLDERCMVR